MTREPVEVTIRAHDALEAYLRRDAETAADWLWLHERWKFAYKPHKRFRLPERRNIDDALSSGIGCRRGVARFLPSLAVHGAFLWLAGTGGIATESAQIRSGWVTWSRLYA